MHTTVKYDHSNNQVNDMNAMRDIVDYLDVKRWHILVDAARDPRKSIAEINFYLGLVGISGYPAHAFLRTFKLDAYREWMGGADEDGSEPIQTDIDGFVMEAV